MKGYLMVLASVVLLALSFIILKFYQRKTDTTTKSSAVFNIYSSICSFLLFFALNGFTMHVSWYSTGNALLKSACGFIYSLIGYRILAEGSVALYTLFLMSGGMIVPAVWGWLFLGEPITALRLIGVIVIVVSIMVNNSAVLHTHPRVIVMCSAVFFLNGMVSVFSKLHQVHTGGDAVGTTDYILISVVITLLMGIGTFLFLHFKDKTHPEAEQQPKKKVSVWLPIAIVLLSSAVGSASSFLQLEGAITLPASVLYPMITGGSIVLSGLFSLLFFGEKISKREWVGIAICTIGTCFFL